MAEYTENLKLFKYDPITDAKQVFSISDALNYNWDILDKNGAGGWNLFDTKITDHVLTGDKAVGWALQGSLVTNTYSDAVSKIKELYSTGTETTYREITCKKSTDGRYIADITQKTAIDNLYTQTGIADFYVLDNDNNSFYLPKTKWFYQFTDNVNNLNNYNEPGLPDIEGTCNGAIEDAGKVYTGAFYDPGNGGRGGNGQFTDAGLGIKASLYNQIYGKSNTVQPASSNKLLYYNVGATLVNSGEINAAQLSVDVQNAVNLVDNKANKDFSNCTKPYITEEIIDGFNWIRKWSNGTLEQGGYSSQSNVTITLNISYKDPNYLVFTGKRNLDNSGANSRILAVYNITSTNFYVTGNYNNGTNTDAPFFWWCTGQI